MELACPKGVLPCAWRTNPLDHHGVSEFSPSFVLIPGDEDPGGSCASHQKHHQLLLPLLLPTEKDVTRSTPSVTLPE